MEQYFEICGTRIPTSTIKDFRIIRVEFIFRPVFRESRKTMMAAIAKKKYEFSHMEAYAAIIGTEGQKSELGEYKAKCFKEALGKDISGAVIYTIADKLKLRAFKQQRYQCINLAGRAFTPYLADVPAKMEWNDGRKAEVYKEDELYNVLNEITAPGIEYITALIIKANEVYCFYGNGIQVSDVRYEYERVKQVLTLFESEKNSAKIDGIERKGLPSFSAVRLLGKSITQKEKTNLEEESNR